MRITYVLAWPNAMGGTARTVVNQANAMAAAGHDVEIVGVAWAGQSPNFPVDPRVRMGTIVSGPVPPSGPGREVPPGESAYASLFSAAVEDAVIGWMRDREDGVLVTTRPALNLLAARYAPARVVRVAQEHLNLASHRPDVRAAILADYPALDAVVTLTRRDQAGYRAAMGGAVRVARIPNALHSLDVPRCDPDAKLVVAAGRLVTQKGFDLLIRAFAKVVERHPDWRLRIHGRGRKERSLRRLINEHHLYNHVFLMGTTRELHRELAKGSVFALSSRFEGFGMVLIEALSHGLPIVSFDCPEGPGEILTDGHDGVLVPPEDVEALADALCAVIEDRSLRADMGEAALRTAGQYGPDSVRPLWEALFAEVSSRTGVA
ncbi:glycosyltransferase family 4 protein [Actinomadura gamaensis]|uniref:Glycosyltransferase family 4 protein n=1 Tax=Actinomadura gamaensis TaxID=1763541 RepID=A0ABV9U2K4_9ACTN